MSVDAQVEMKKYGVMKCSNGQYVSTLHICDGYKDCSDGTDGLNCFCFVNGKKIIDNIFCVKNCSMEHNCICQNLYSNDGLHGCHSVEENHNGKHTSPLKQSLFSCKDSNFNISNTLVNDLIFDCPCEDDEPELLNETQKYRQKCTDVEMHERYPGHSRCYNKHKKCIYNLTIETQSLVYCRNGEHLQNCETAEHSWMFKCPNSYCIPYRFICDGKWDCWNGDDEMNCVNFTCVSMFKCKLSLICVHTNDSCDGKTDCPLNDDERICIEVNCFYQCSCLNYGISCHTELAISRHSLFSLLTNFVFINISNQFFDDNIDPDRLKDTIVLITMNNDLTEPLFCYSLVQNVSLKLLDLSYNTIIKLDQVNFICMIELMQVILNHNKISQIDGSVSMTLTKLKLLDPSSNNLVGLQRHTFCCFSDLLLLDIRDNDIIYVNRDIFSDVKVNLILTDDFHICCMASDLNSICTSKPLWPSSCNDLLSTVGLKGAVWLLGTLIVLCNLFLIYYIIIDWCKENVLKDY